MAHCTEKARTDVPEQPSSFRVHPPGCFDSADESIDEAKEMASLSITPLSLPVVRRIHRNFEETVEHMMDTD
jgi:hypothetical protein